MTEFADDDMPDRMEALLAEMLGDDHFDPTGFELHVLECVGVAGGGLGGLSSEPMTF